VKAERGRRWLAYGPQQVGSGRSQAAITDDRLLAFEFEQTGAGSPAHRGVLRTAEGAGAAAGHRRDARAILEPMNGTRPPPTPNPSDRVPGLP